MEEHAQLEIRSYANIIGNEIVRRWCPLTWEAFLDYNMNCMMLSGNEIHIIRSIISGDKKRAIKIADELGWLPESKKSVKKDLERVEFEAKLKRLNLSVPW